MVYNQFIDMPHLKLFFPGLSTSSGLCQFLYGHSGLASLSLTSQEQGCDLSQDRKKTKCQPQRRAPIRWRRYDQKMATYVKIQREKIENLTYIQDVDSNDYWSQEKDDQFVHALQLEEDQCRFNDVETVRSERWSTSSRKMSISSDTESIECIDSVIVPIQ